jgi:hypothetical protein
MRQVVQNFRDIRLIATGLSTWANNNQLLCEIGNQNGKPNSAQPFVHVLCSMITAKRYDEPNCVNTASLTSFRLQITASEIQNF